MLQTQSSGPGEFINFDLSRISSPCFVIDEEKLKANLAILREIKQCSGAQILLALKAFSMWSLSELIEESLDGCCASGLWEALLARNKGFASRSKGKILSTFCPGYSSAQFDEICNLSNHIILNNPFAEVVYKKKRNDLSYGLRINPLHSEGTESKYDPCCETSRFGWPINRINEINLDVFEGLHFHTLCEQDFPPLKRTWQKIEDEMGPILSSFKWINLGGGHHLTRPGYDIQGLSNLILEISSKYGCQVFLEPGEAVAFDAGILVGQVLDIMKTGFNHAILDLSATCHSPDVIEAPYRPALLQESPTGYYKYYLGGSSCLTADSFGCYKFDTPLRVGERLAFLDQAHYTMVKTNTFNGVMLPSIAIWNSKTDELKMVRSFSYKDFEERLS